MTCKHNWEWKIGNNNVKNRGWNVDNVYVPFFYMVFPVDIDSKNIWSICEKFGYVSDVYIARKPSKIGKSFAYDRFIKVKY